MARRRFPQTEETADADAAEATLIRAATLTAGYRLTECRHDDEEMPALPLKALRCATLPQRHR